jgi:flagellar protein FliO/FliZ
MELDAVAYLRFIAALVFVIGLMLALLWALRRFGPAGMVTRPGSRRRLGIVESHPIDSRHRLVLVRRDDTEHLLLIGGGSSLVIETGTKPPATEDKA